MDSAIETHSWELGEGYGMFEVDKRRNWKNRLGSEEAGGRGIPELGSEGKCPMVHGEGEEVG